MDSVNQIFLQAIEYFPRWMAIRRKPYTSTQGNLLYSILAEAESLAEEITKYKKEFFLVNYLGSESDILETLYAAHVGVIDDEDFDNITIKNFQQELTTDITYFRDNVDTMYYQDGYLLIRPQLINDDNTYIQLTYNDYPYSIQWQKMHVWNVFDEFAWFAGLTRYDDETNKELCTRTIATFKNRTNVTKQGLKNAIVNIASDIISESDITIEQPDENTLALADIEYGTIFERLAQMNKDLARTKQWDTTYWQNSFKQLAYLPHVWDAEVRLYQDGTGYNNSLKVYTTSELQDVKSTNVSVVAYKKSKKKIEQYIQQNAIKRNLTLSLKRYKDVINATKLQYRIKASNVVKLNPEQITFNGYQTSSGTSSLYLSDVILGSQNVEEIKHGDLAAGNTYQLIFYPNGPTDSTGNHYGTMQIDSCTLTESGKETSLLTPSGQFAIRNGVFQNVDVKYYTDTIKNLTTYQNLQDTDYGICISDIANPAQLTINVEDAQNQYVYLQKHCATMEYIDNTEFVSYNGFTLNNRVLTDVNSDFTSTIDINLTSVIDFSFDLATNQDATKQGTIVFDVTVNKKTEQHQMNQAGTFSLHYDAPTDIQIHIRKNGVNPVSVQNILASRYAFNLYVKNTDGTESSILQTSFGFIVPNNAKTLVLDMQAYGNVSPYIDFIHIGTTLSNSTTYVIKDIAPQSTASLSVDTNCRMDLVNVTTGTITRNYTTKSTYYNNTQDNGIVYIDISKYVSIDSSTPKIYQDDGTGDNYVIINPGESLDCVTITGSIHKLLEVQKLSDILAAQNLSEYSCYANNNIEGILIQKGQTEDIFTLSREMLNLNCDTYRLNIVDSDVRPVFIQDDTHRVVTNETSNPFESVTFEPVEYKEYIAYNTVTMLQAEMSHVAITYNFSPVLSATTLVVYQITDMPEGAHIQFEKSDGNYYDWSLGQKELGLHILLDTKQEDVSNYQAEIKTLQQSFLISTSIPLADTYLVDGESVTLASYIITPPDGMQIEYELHAAMDTIRVENDGFTKLLYSNVTSIESIEINDQIISPEEYSLLEEAGIVVWTNKNRLGETAIVRYVYQKPVALSFVSIDDIYNLVEYTIDAYEQINETADVFTNKKAGDIIYVSYPEVDHITAACNADRFVARPSEDNTYITVYDISQTNMIAIHNGYIYDSGLEYWMFANQFEEPFEHYNGVTFINVEKLPGQLLFFIESTNYIHNSAMIQSYLDTLCVVDFRTNKHIPEISHLQSITACDSYTGWYAFNMDVGLKTNDAGYSLTFTPIESYGYAALEVTDYLQENDTFDIDYEGDLTMYLCKDILIRDMHLRKNVYAEPIAELTQGKYTVTDYDEQNKYYLVVVGEGVIHEIILANEPEEDVHTKNLTKFGFSIFETRQTNSIVPLGFSPSFSIQNGTEFDRKNELMMGMNVDYGLTLLQNVNFNLCQINQITYLKDVFETGSESGSILTPTLELPSYQGIYMLHIKINNVLLEDSYKNYVVELLTSDSISGPFVSSYTKEDVNDVSFSRKYLNKYVRFRITMPRESVVDNISILATYNETSEYAPRISYNKTGSMTTKLFDTCEISDYQLTQIDASQVKYPEFISFEIRACREDKTTVVWTDWEQVIVDKDLNVTSQHIYRDYRLFQLRVTLKDSKSRIHLDGIRLKVVK